MFTKIKNCFSKTKEKDSKITLRPQNRHWNKIMRFLSMPVLQVKCSVDIQTTNGMLKDKSDKQPEVAIK